MKKIILLMFLTFSNMTLVYADELDNKVETYKNIITQISDNILSDTPNHDLHLILQQQSDALMNEIKTIVQHSKNALECQYAGSPFNKFEFDKFQFKGLDEMNAASNKFNNLIQWTGNVNRNIRKNLQSTLQGLTENLNTILMDFNVDMQTINAETLKFKKEENKINNLLSWTENII